MRQSEGQSKKGGKKKKKRMGGAAEEKKTGKMRKGRQKEEQLEGDF